MKSLYLIVDLSAFIVPFAFSFHPKLGFAAKHRQWLPAIAITCFVFILWDVWFTKIAVWRFNPDYVLGVSFLGLPVEEILFFICIPYACLFSYHCLCLLVPSAQFRKVEPFVSFVLPVALLVTAAFYYPRLYTVVTFASLAVFLATLRMVFRVPWLGRFYFSFVVMLLPFFVVNGILTGTGPDAPVVIYNNQQNMGVRLLTIPLEDMFYGMLFQMMNVSLFEYFGRKSA